MITKQEVEYFKNLYTEYLQVAQEELGTSSTESLPGNIEDYIVSEINLDEIEAWDIATAVSGAASASIAEQQQKNRSVKQLAAVRLSGYKRELMAKHAVELLPEAFPGVTLSFNDFGLLCAQTGHGKSTITAQAQASLALRHERTCCIHLEQDLFKSSRDIVLNIMNIGDVSEHEAIDLFTRYVDIIEGVQDGYNHYDKFVQRILDLADPTKYAAIFVDNLDNLVDSSQGVQDKTPEFARLNTVLAGGLQKNFLLSNNKLYSPVLFLKQLRNQPFQPEQLHSLPENLTKAKILAATCTTILQYARFRKPKLNENGKVDRHHPGIPVAGLGLYKTRERYLLGEHAQDYVGKWMYAVPRKSKLRYCNPIIVSPSFLRKNTDSNDEVAQKEINDIIELIGV